LPRPTLGMTNTQSMDGQLCCKLVGNQKSEIGTIRARGRSPGVDRTRFGFLPRTSLSFAMNVSSNSEIRPLPTELSPHGELSPESSLTYPDQLSAIARRRCGPTRSIFPSSAEAASFRTESKYPRPLEALRQDRLSWTSIRPIPIERLSWSCKVDWNRVARRIAADCSRFKDARDQQRLVADSLHRAGFVAKDLVSGAQVRLQLLCGNPVLMIFFNPSSSSASETRGFGSGGSTKIKPMFG